MGLQNIDCRARRRGLALAASVLIVVLVSGESAPSAAQPGEELERGGWLTNAAMVLDLAPEEAKREHPVRIEGVITCFDARSSLCFVQDATAGIYVYLDPAAGASAVEPGDRVRIEGVSGRGPFSPIVMRPRVSVLGRGELPAPLRVSFEQLASGAMDSQWVEVEGVVRTQVKEWGQCVLVMAHGGDRLTVRVLQEPFPADGSLVDALAPEENGLEGVPKRAGLWLRSPEDVTLLARPAERDRGAGPLALVALLPVAGGGLLWMLRLRRRDAETTERFQTAALEIRCEELEETLRQNEERLRRLVESRDRIERDLHDGLIQSLYAIGLSIEQCRRSKEPGPEVNSKLEAVRRDINSLIRDVRNFIGGLEPEALSGKEFTAALKSLVLTMGQENNRLILRIDPIASESLDSNEATQLLHIAREALSNSLRHAGAQRTILSLELRQDHLCFEVQDDGAGFDPESARLNGFGLRNMADRARRIGATFRIDSVRGKGTSVQLALKKRGLDGCERIGH